MESQPQNHEFRINPENFHPSVQMAPSRACWPRFMLSDHNYCPKYLG